MNNRPGFVYFDLGNVLLNFDHEIACTNLARVCQRDADSIRRVVFESELQEKYEDGRIGTSEFHESFCQELGVQIGIAELCHEASAIFEPNYPVLPIVTQLQRTGVPMGILSNTCSAHWDYVIDGKYCFLNQLFTVYTLSFEAGSSKPDQGIYQRAIEAAGVKPEEIFFVDDRAENVKGALANGFDAVQFTDSLDLARELISRDLLRTF